MAESDRYRVVRVLGRGGMGEVHLVHDAVRQQLVARKRILTRSTEAMLRFKREFRLIEQLVHPGLVRLHELGEDAGGLYFTMEAIDGVDLMTYCTGGPFPPFPSDADEPQQSPGTGEPAVPDPFAATVDSGVEAAASRLPRERPTGWQVDLNRLVHVLPQIVEALAFLHHSGIVHRDLKPGNIMVRRDGTAKLLDFGVLGELAPRRPRGRGEEGEVVGTVGYMAPEQLAGDPPTPSSDLYALGATLFQVVSGREVFQGTTSEVITGHLSTDPPLLSTVVPGIHPALARGCAALLQKEPERRPGVTELGPLLLEPLGARRPILSAPRPPRPPLEGREEQQRQLLERLEQVQAGHFGLLALCGPTGVGKSSLAAWFAEQAADRGAAVLQGRGRPTERVPFNALDRCIDGLALQLGHRRRHRGRPEWTRAAEVAAAAFPVLALAGTGIQPRAGAARTAAFAALVSLLAGEAARVGGLVLIVDDLQWADDDSLALLDHLVEAAPPGVLVLATLRDDVGANPASSWIATQEQSATMQVSALSDGAVAAIIERRAREEGVAPEPDALQRAVAACGGHPYLAELAGRALGRRQEMVAGLAVQASLAGLLAGADPRARQVLALLVAADEWTPVDALAGWAALTPGEVLDSLGPLEHDGLVRLAGLPGHQQVDLYHGAVRDAALSVLAREALREAHGRIAAQLAAEPERHARRLVRHLLGADRVDDAASHARLAAHQAEDQRAFALAAELYEVALRRPGEQRAELLRLRALALERSASYRAAVDCWRELAEIAASTAQRTDAELHQAHALLAAGDQRAGRQRLDTALSASGEATVGRGGLADLLAGLRFLLGPGRGTVAGAPAPAAPGALERAERDVRVGQLVGYFDVLSGIRWLRRARRGFVRESAAEQAAWCDYVFAYFALFGTRRRGPVALAERYLRSAAAQLEGRTVQSPEVRVMPDFLAGVAAQRDGRWSDGSDALDRAVQELDRQGVEGTFEHMMALVHRTQLDLFAQNLTALERSLARLRAATHGTGDSATRCHLVFIEALRLICRGQFQDAADLAQELAESWQMDQPSYQRFIVSAFVALTRIYLGDPARARRELAGALRRERAFRPLQSMYGGLYGAVCALAEASALRLGDRQASARRCRRYAALAREATPMWTAGAWRARAYAADAGGRPERALALLEQAEAEAAQFGQQLDVAVARYQRGLRLGGDAGAGLQQEARRLVQQIGAGVELLDEDPGHR